MHKNFKKLQNFDELNGENDSSGQKYLRNGASGGGVQLSPKFNTTFEFFDNFYLMVLNEKSFSETVHEWNTVWNT